jgi:hypothetical protein
MRFLVVFSGAKDVANVVHPPKGAAIDRGSGELISRLAIKQMMARSATIAPGPQADRFAGCKAANHYPC